jgi:hypothetical protein
MDWFWNRGWIRISLFLWLGGTATLVAAVVRGASPHILSIALPSLLLVGLAVGIKRQEVKVGQLLAVSGGAFAFMLTALPIDGDVRDSFGLPILVMSSVAYTLAAPALIGALLVFPDGRLLSPRWRWVGGALLVWPLFDGAARVAKLFDWSSRVSASVGDSWFAVGMFFMISALVSLVVRARIGNGMVRRQIGWVAYGVALYIVFLLGAVAFFGFDDERSMFVTVDQVFFTAIPLAIWVAVSRYRLYDLDRLVSRTVAYVAVVAVLAATYLAALALFSSLLPVEDEMGVAVSTLAVVVAFAPVRRRILEVVDRRFFRTRYHAQEVFDSFARRLRLRPIDGTIEDDLVAVLGQTLSPEKVGVWGRSS